MITTVLHLTHQRTPTVLLTGVNFSSGAELSRVFHISLVEIITVLFGDGSHGDLGGPDRVGVAGGVVVLRHPPSGDLTVPPPQPADRVVLLHRGTDGFDVGPERDEAASREGCTDCRRASISAVVGPQQHRLQRAGK